MAIDKTRKAECIAAIKLHLINVGPTDWGRIVAQFPDITRSAIYRWIDEAKGGPDKAQLALAKVRIEKRAKSAQAIPGPGVTAEDEEGLPTGEQRAAEADIAMQRHLARQLPATPSPAYIAREGEAALKRLDFAAELNHLYGDALMLRAYSVKTDDKGAESIKNPMLFERQIMARTKLIESAISTVRELWDLRTMQDAYMAVLDEVGKESPECQQRILLRLQALNARMGMTMFARF